MSAKREWLIFLVVVIVTAVLLMNLRFLGLSVVNTTSNVTVGIVNTPPSIVNLNNSLYVCEDSILYHEFNVTDPDGDVLTGSITPENPFFIFWISQPAVSTTTFAIVSGIIDKGDIGGVNTWNKTYNENVSIKDDYASNCCYTYNSTNITVIEINHAPVIEDVGVKTIWNKGDNASLYEVVTSTDYEYNLSYGNFTFNSTVWNSSGHVVNLFSINSSGVFNFTANLTTALGVYTVQACVNDTGLSNPYSGIQANCSQTGGSMQDCDNFTLTITEENRAPSIVNYSPLNLDLSFPGTTLLKFNITNRDPDGTIPDAYWSVDGIFKEKDEGNLTEFFEHIFGCGVSGAHNVSVEITDGLLNDSMSWNVSVSFVSCSSGGSSSGGGGGGGGAPSVLLKVEPQVIATKVFQGEGKSFDIKVTNVGSIPANISVRTENLTDLALVSEDKFLLNPGQEKIVRAYIYSLSNSKQGVYYGNIIFESQSTRVNVNVVLEVKEREPLFDLAVEVLPDYKTVTAGEDVLVDVNMLNVGLYGTAVDVEFYLFITDFNRLILYQTSKEVIAVEKNVSVRRDLRVPLDTASGNYLVLAQATYGNVSVTSYDTFAVVEKKYLRAAYFLILIFILAALLFILFLLWKRRKKKKEEERYR